MKDRFAVPAILIVAMSSLVAGFLGGRPGSAPGDLARQDEFRAQLSEALEMVEQESVNSISADQLLHSAIKSMLHTLDPHSSFFDAKEFARLREEQHSTYYGLGVTVRRLQRDNGRSVVIEPPVAGSPAARLGIRAGDIITHIGGEAIDDLSPDEVMDHLRGARGTWVTITVERVGVRNPLLFKVERDEIPMATVPYAFEVKPGIGYIRIESFSKSTADELKQKLENLKAQKLSGLILDLRNNPGGLLSQAIDVADLFLPRGQLIVSTKGRARGSAGLYRTVGLEKIHVPVVVLINKQSASASEIVAGALQDHDRALIVGETSFGKGLVQSVYALGNNTGMALTTARYYTPSGRQIQRDYSGAGIQYYFQGGRMAHAGKAREIRQTDSGRTVLGGGGIAPDIEEPARELNRFETLLSSKQLLFEYARRSNLGQAAAAGRFRLPLQSKEVGRGAAEGPQSMAPLEITDGILEDFKEFLRSRRIEFKSEDIVANLDFIKRGIIQEVYTSSFGRQEGLRIAIQGDNQVLRALEVLPEARSLMTSGHMTPAPRRPGIC
jgi:carboxyl-terminal processing protease